MTFSIADKLNKVRERIQKATKEANRPDNTVELLAVTKTRGAEVLSEALAAGLHTFGENYLNEALEKQEHLKILCGEEKYAEIQWHFIGPIQSNKTRPIAEHFSWVHSVDREKIIQRLNDQRPESLLPLNCCIQVNIDDEASKSGVVLAEVDQFASLIAASPNLCLRGLMCIPKADQDEVSLRSAFQRLADAFERLKLRYPSMDTLSMGMSGDIEIAIECGSTMVRVGTALFGERI